MSLCRGNLGGPCAERGGRRSSTSQVARVDNHIHCALLSHNMAFRPLLRQVSDYSMNNRAYIDVL
jgi:hypothetical protein